MPGSQQVSGHRGPLSEIGGQLGNVTIMLKLVSKPVINWDDARTAYPSYKPSRSGAAGIVDSLPRTGAIKGILIGVGLVVPFWVALGSSIYLLLR